MKVHGEFLKACSNSQKSHGCSLRNSRKFHGPNISVLYGWKLTKYFLIMIVAFYGTFNLSLANSNDTCVVVH